MYFLLFNFSVINLFPTHRSDQHLPKSLYHPIPWIDESKVVAPFVDHDNSSGGPSDPSKLKLFLSVNVTLYRFLSHKYVSLQITNGLCFNQRFCCNFRRFKCLQFFERRQTFLTFVATPAFFAICLAVKLEIDIIRITARLSRAVRHCGRSQLFLFP